MKQNCLVVINHTLYFTVKNNRKKDKLEVFNQKKQNYYRLYIYINHYNNIGAPQYYYY